MRQSTHNLILAIVGVLVIGYMAAQCQKVTHEKPSPSVTVTVK